MELLTQVVLLVVGFGLLIKGADFFVDGASGLATRFGIPQIVIGLTIVAFGTSAPEAAVSITAAFKGNAGITIGNVIGSNVFNILVILGITALIVPIRVKKNTIKFEIPYVVVMSVLLGALGLFDGRVGLLDGIVLWVCMLVFMVYLLKLAKAGESEEVSEGMSGSLWKLLFFMLGGLVVIIWGSDITVDSAVKIAELFGVDDRIIGLTIVAMGTSLPELVTSVTAAIKGNADIAVGNIVGSNIFNILFVVGTAALITPVVYAGSFWADTIICVLSAVLLWICVAKKNLLGRAGGAVLLLCYEGYLIYLL